MTIAANLPLAGYRALNFRRVDDPGAVVQTFSFHSLDVGIARVVTATAETRVLPPAGNYRPFTKLIVSLVEDGGDLTITGADQTPILQDVYDTVEFEVVVNETNDPFVNAWRVTSDSRGGENATEAKTMDLAINAGLVSGPWLADGRTNLTAVAADPDCSLITSDIGTANPLIRAGTVTLVAATAQDFATITNFTVPDDYVAGGNLTVTLAITEDTSCDNPDLETVAFNRDAPTTDIVVAPTGDIDLSTGSGNFAITLLGTNVVAGDTIDVQFNFELTDTASPTPQYDLTRATLGYTGNAQ